MGQIDHYLVFVEHKPLEFRQKIEMAAFIKLEACHAENIEGNYLKY